MKVKEYYNGIAKGYNELYRREQLNKWEVARKLIKFSQEDLVLDLGCGTGIISEFICGGVKSIIGVDLSEEMIKNACKNKKITYLCSKARNLPFNDNTFDKVVSFTMLQDVKNWEPTLREINRVAKKTVLLTILKRRKRVNSVKKRLSKYFHIKEFIEEEKDFIFLLEKK